MTNPHDNFKAKPLASLQAPQLSTTTRWIGHGLRCFALGLTLIGATAGFARAQSVEALEWQPGQSTLPAVISTPHNDVRKLLRQAKYPAALLVVNKSLSTNPRDPQMRFWQGYIFEQMGQPEMAQQVYLGLTQEYPELAEPHNNLGVIYAAKGDYPNAKASLDAALRANPNYASAHENMGDLLVNMARQSYERSLAIDAKQRDPAQKIERLKPVLEITQGKP
jgi:Flp pilus assembly protein TadD